MLTGNKQNFKKLDTSFLDTIPTKQATPHIAQGDVNTSGKTDNNSYVRTSILSLRFGPPPRNRSQHKVHPGLGSLIQDDSGVFQSPPPITSVKGEPGAEFVKKIEISDHTDTFYENTWYFDQRVFWESPAGAFSTPGTTKNISFGISTEFLDEQEFHFNTTTAAKRIQASLAIPQSVENQELINWAHRYGITTSVECFRDLLRTVNIDQATSIIELDSYRGTKRTAPEEFSKPPAKAICKEVPKLLGAPPKRRAGKVDKKHRPRIIETSIFPKQLSTRPPGIQLAKGRRL